MFVQDSFKGTVDLDHELFLSACNTVLKCTGPLAIKQADKCYALDPDVTVKIKDAVFSGKACLVEDHEEDALVRQLVGGKYQEIETGLDEWLRSALPVAVELAV